MKFTVMTLFPDMILETAKTSIMGRAMEAGVLSVEAVDIRDYTHNKFRHVDDYPFGGGAGMVIEAAPVYECWQDIVRDKENKPRVVYMTPKGRTFDQQMARELAQEDELILLCGHYEGIDQRALDLIVTDEISIGDYVLTGGELPALVVMDAVARMVEGVLGNSTSAEDESFSGMYLEYPQYTRPRIFEGMEVPEVLLNGNHAAIEEWRLRESMKITLERRPDLIDPERMSAKERKIYAEIVKNHC
ncbi:MAG: tRNA (guanosine(37)-N1)-methyltransferase TrmD [Firmicutes bacterium]|nr:tRNA (guanosine(37)-N1)-methyltransferase TrmD [Bacillota bacterium]